jgi:hypothetical protein
MVWYLSIVSPKLSFAVDKGLRGGVAPASVEFVEVLLGLISQRCEFEHRKPSVVTRE